MFGEYQYQVQGMALLVVISTRYWIGPDPLGKLQLNVGVEEAIVLWGEFAVIAPSGVQGIGVDVGVAVGVFVAYEG